MAFEFRTSLLREKFTLTDISKGLSDEPPVIALSNRLELDLITASGNESEKFVVRAQNMHTCVRFAASIQKEFSERGPIMARVTDFRWDNLWHDVTKGYEKDWNPNIWGVVYFKGRPVFSDGTHHAFLDVIEQCDAINKEEYEHSVSVAEGAFQKAGKTVKIDHDMNVALVVKITDFEARCGVVLRSASRKTTFNFTATPFKKDPEKPMSPATVLTVCAAFLEGIQLSFEVGLYHKKKEFDLIEKYSDEDRKGERATARMANLNTAIMRFEQKHTMFFRPDRPDLPAMVTDAEKSAMRILKPQIEEMIATGKIKPEAWIS